MDNKLENLPRMKKQRKKLRMMRECLISMSNRGKDHLSHILGKKKNSRNRSYNEDVRRNFSKTEEGARCSGIKKIQWKLRFREGKIDSKLQD